MGGCFCVVSGKCFEIFLTCLKPKPQVEHSHEGMLFWMVFSINHGQTDFADVGSKPVFEPIFFCYVVVSKVSLVVSELRWMKSVILGR